jgi:two-component system, sensor histidine kinase and response regulator
MMAAHDVDTSVLIVEDDEETAEGLADTLRIMGYPSEVAANGKVALDRLRAAPRRYCLVLLDVTMPVMDGWGFLNAHCGDAAIAAIPVIIVSAGLNTTTRAAQTSAVAVLSKPVDAVALEATLQRYC